MHAKRTTAIAIAFVAIVAFAYPIPVHQVRGSPGAPATLSPYWTYNVSRWSDIIFPYAHERRLDPDLIAAVIWKESLGQPRAQGPAGAVGLMGVMPFEWRPDVEELQNPWTNVAWGARALAYTIRDGQGDVFYALAAYNGGWEKISSRGPRQYAADVLLHYAKAVAMRNDLSPEGNWIAIIAVENGPYPQTITVVSPRRPLARYTERPWIEADIPTVPIGAAPHATLITFTDKYDREHAVNMWLTTENGVPFPVIVSPQSLVVDYVTPSTVLSATIESPLPFPQPVGTPLPTRTPVFTPTVDVELTLTETLSSPLPSLTPSPVATVEAPTPTIVPTPPISVTCERGPLQIQIWPLEKHCALDGGWDTTIFISGQGGDCVYTYTWEGEIIGGPMTGPLTFPLHQTDRFGKIIGTASVTSGGETVSTSLFVNPPGVGD